MCIRDRDMGVPEEEVIVTDLPDESFAMDDDISSTFSEDTAHFGSDDAFTGSDSILSTDI